MPVNHDYMKRRPMTSHILNYLKMNQKSVKAEKKNNTKKPSILQNIHENLNQKKYRDDKNFRKFDEINDSFVELNLSTFLKNRSYQQLKRLMIKDLASDSAFSPCLKKIPSQSCSNIFKDIERRYFSKINKFNNYKEEANKINLFLKLLKGNSKKNLYFFNNFKIHVNKSYEKLQKIKQINSKILIKDSKKLTNKEITKLIERQNKFIREKEKKLNHKCEIKKANEENEIKDYFQPTLTSKQFSTHRVYLPKKINCEDSPELFKNSKTDLAKKKMDEGSASSIPLEGRIFTMNNLNDFWISRNNQNSRANRFDETIEKQQCNINIHKYASNNIERDFISYETNCVNSIGINSVRAQYFNQMIR